METALSRPISDANSRVNTNLPGTRQQWPPPEGFGPTMSTKTPEKLLRPCRSRSATPADDVFSSDNRVGRAAAGLEGTSINHKPEFV
jgi:hypothetical protein